MRFLSIGLMAFCSANVRAATYTIDGNGINSKRLELTGEGVAIGQVESVEGRSGKSGYDLEKFHSQTKPTQVYFSSQVDQPDSHVSPHGTEVAGVMIASGMGQELLEGVAPLAQLHSGTMNQAFGEDDGASLAMYRLTQVPNMRAINLSWGRALNAFQSPNGNNHLAQFVDWSARVHNVLYVTGNTEQGRPNIVTPQDNFNGMTVAASTFEVDISQDPFYDRVWSGNTYLGDASGAERVSVDLLAPGFFIRLTSYIRDDPMSPFHQDDPIKNGTSYAAPHVTGAVALLHQYANARMNTAAAHRHEVIKAILLNSADKLVDVHGSARNVIRKDGKKFNETTAFFDDAVSLDMEIGAGHLNVTSAIYNYLPGEFNPGVVPRIGWDSHTVAQSNVQEYTIVEPLAAGDWVTVTLTWDRFVESTNVGTDYLSGDMFFPGQLNDLDLYLISATNVIAAKSISADDNVEHIFFQIQNAGQYRIGVQNLGGFSASQSYAVAWWAGEDPHILGDFDDNGDVNGNDLSEWKSDFGINDGSDSGFDGDSDGNDFLVWQRNLGTGIPATPAGAPVPEPRMGLLCCFALPLLTWGRRSMNRRAAALLVGISVGMVAAQHASAAEITLTRNSRTVTSAEVAGGAPSDGLVHDFLVTSDADLLSVLADINVSVYQHPYGNDHSAPHPQLVALFPALAANSFLRLPSDTIVMGGGFQGAGPDRVWGDLVNDGPQTNFLFGRLTTNQSGSFSGRFAVRGTTSVVDLPFTMELPGPGDSLLGSFDELLSLSGSEPILAPPPAPVPAGLDLNQSTSPDFRGPVTIELTRRSRPVSDREQHFDAPEGYVHEFFVTTNTDLISIGNVEIEGPVYRHPRGSDRKPPNARVLSLWPGSSADSFITTPGTTDIAGNGFYGNKDAEIIWYDYSDDGPLKEFLFAQLTVSETGSFSGDINVRGPDGRVSLPFKFALPGTESDLALLEGEQTYRLELSFDKPSAGAAVPEPPAWMLGALGALLLARQLCA